MFLYVSQALCTGFSSLPASWHWATVASKTPKTPHLPCFQHFGPSKTPHLPYFGPLCARRGLLGAPGALEWAARAPSRCPLGTRRCCSSPHSVAPERSKGLLELPFGAPERSKGLLQPPASTRCPRCARRGCSSLLGAPCARTTAFRVPARAAGSRATSWVIECSR